MKLIRAVITGTIVVHDLGNEVFHFKAEHRRLTLRGELRLSDAQHQIAAHIIARELSILVIWQDLCGRKHFVEPGTLLDHTSDLLRSLDPRDQFQPASGTLN